jgi:hypothetical protein
MVMHQNQVFWFFDPKNHADTWWAVSNNRPTLIKAPKPVFDYFIKKLKEPPVPVFYFENSGHKIKEPF